MGLPLGEVVNQADFGELVGISQPAVSDLIDRRILTDGAPLGQWLLEYCDNLREQAAGRNQELGRERARLAREQADKIAMDNAERRRELAPVSLLTEVLARIGRHIAARLEAVPVQVKRRMSDIDPAVLNLLEEEIVAARNDAHSMNLDMVLDGLEGDTDSSASGSETAISCGTATPV